MPDSGSGSGVGGILGAMNPIGGALQGLGSFLNPLLNFFSGRATFNQQKEQASRIANGADFERDLFQNVYDPLRQILLGQTDVGNLMALGNAENPGILTRLTDTLGMQPAQINSLFASLGITPEQAQFLDPLTQWAGGDRAIGEALAGRGNVAAGNNDQLASFFSQLMNGGISQIGANAGESLLANNGQTVGTNFLADRLKEIVGTGGKGADLTSLMQVLMNGVATGGMTPELQQGISKAMQLLGSSDPAQQLGLSTASNILSTGGATPTSQTAQNQALQFLLNGGQTPESQAASAAGLNRIAQNPILPMQDAIGYLTSTIGSQALKSSTEGARQAALRGQGSAGAVASGGQNLARREASRAGLETTANAITDMMLKQQQLGLQNNQIGADLLGTGNTIASGRLNTGAGLLSSLQNSDTSRFNAGAGLLDSMLGRGLQQTQTGFSGLNTTQGTADSRLAQFLQGGLTGTGQSASNINNALSMFGNNNNQEMNNMLTGNTLSTSFLDNLFKAAGGLQNTSNANAGLAQLGNTFGNSAYGALNSGLSGFNTSMAGNRQSLNDYLSAINTNIGNQFNLGNTFLGMSQQANQGLGQLMSGTNNSFAQLLSSLGGIFR